MIASIQMAIIGFGGKSYQKYIYKGDVKELKKHYLIKQELNSTITN